MSNKHYCYSCFREINGEDCPYCGFQARNELRPSIALPLGAILNGRYLLGKVLGIGGFGVTYLAYDLMLEQKVAIKEYLPTGIATREDDHYSVSAVSIKERDSFQSGESKFLDEARILAKLKDTDHIVSVYNFFKENGSAYFAMEYVEGLSLKEFLRQQGGHISIEQALSLLLPIMNALSEVHAQGLLHRDISPDNIYISNKGVSMLLDFGAARFALSNDKSFSVILKHGFAPEEQYRTHGNQGPWTDVYAMSATLYNAICGVLPPDALERVHQDSLLPPSQLGCRIAAQTEAALMRGLAIKAEDRYPNMASFVLALGGGQVDSRFIAEAINSSTNSSLNPSVVAQVQSPQKTNATDRRSEQEHIASSSYLASDMSEPKPKGIDPILSMLKNKQYWPWIGAAIAALLLAIVLPLAFLGGKKNVPGSGGVGGEQVTIWNNTPKETSYSTATESQASEPPLSTNTSTTTVTAVSTENITAADNQKVLRNNGLGIEISLPGDLTIDNSDSLSYFFAQRDTYTNIACSFAYACGAPMYSLEDFRQNVAEILPYAMGSFNLNLVPSLQELSDVSLGQINALKADFTCADNTAEWSLYGFSPLNGPGCYFLIVGQDTKDPLYEQHKAEIEQSLSGLSLFAEARTDQVIVNADYAGLRMVYDGYYGIPNGIENIELFHMYFDESQFPNGRASINVFDMSDKATTLDEAVLFLQDQFVAFATVTSEPQLSDVYTLGSKEMRSVFLDFTYNDDTSSRLMHGTTHVIKIGTKIFALQGFFDDVNAAAVTKQLDLIGVSLDLQ